MSDINETVDAFVEAREDILKHVGFVEGWRIFPISDDRDNYWCIDTRGPTVRFSPNRDSLEDEEVYENTILDLAQPHGNRCGIFRGPTLTLVVGDTQTDGNVFLQIFSNDHEVTKI